MCAYYVPTDSKGIEHAAAGRIQWELPDGGLVRVTRSSQLLVLRPADRVLEVLDERIYAAESVGTGTTHADGTMTSESARLTSRTYWDIESATKFAISVAEHALAPMGAVSLPDGTTLEEVLGYARQVLDGTSPDAHDHLGYLARLRALRRLSQEQGELSDHNLGVLVEDEARSIDALDDPAYASVIPVADSVLASIEALRHHVFPALYMDFEDAAESRGEHGSIGLRYEPAWASAREAARHARMAAQDRGGADGETTERLWQAQLLESVLHGASGSQDEFHTEPVLS
jgi:hypothetical protein